MRVDAVIVGDDAAAWNDAGFTTDGDTIAIGPLVIECRGDDAPPRMRLWADDVDVPAKLDGIPTDGAAAPRTPVEFAHPNRVVDVDHIVLASPDLDRTTTAFAALDVECRRIREIPGSDPAMQQRFFRMGPVILELVGRAEPTGDGPASIWGLAFTVDDIDAAVTHLGSACGAPKDAVQEGRQIATVRTRELGISLPIALMTPAPPRR